MPDRIEKRIELSAPVSRVWRAISDYREFGEWFGVNLEGPFVPGQPVTGKMKNPKYAHVTWTAIVHEVQPERLFSFHWRPYAIEPGTDYSAEPMTLVEFRLTPIASGTLLEVSESGFEGIPEHRRDEAFRMNERGWAAQVQNIANHVSAHP